MDNETYEELQKLLTLILAFATPLFMAFMGFVANKYADSHRGTMFGRIAGMIALGIEYKYGKTLPNEEKKALAEKALTDKSLRKDLLIEAGVAQLKQGVPAPTVPCDPADAQP